MHSERGILVRESPGSMEAEVSGSERGFRLAEVVNRNYGPKLKSIFSKNEKKNGTD